ncbi:MAG: C45 family autoproteolytic acyltransferase/hydrolase [Anaerolineae bacterium]|nr:C45 family autoproteolytic acyltransferase/hydrolase [Anaerolineae bacterium]
MLTLTGTPYEMGYQHGRAFYEAIHHFTEERLHLSGDPVWAGRPLTREAVLRLGQACLAEHERYSPILMQELRGMADATGLGLAELVIMNGFTDFVDVVYRQGEAIMPPLPSDNCTAFLVPPGLSASGQGLYGQTWDMHATATPHVILLHGQPQDAPHFLAFTITGCVGMIGMNEAGIAIGINNLTASDGQIGVTWPFVIREALRQDTLEAALACITGATLAGGHNYLLMDKHGRTMWKRCPPAAMWSRWPKLRWCTPITASSRRIWTWNAPARQNRWPVPWRGCNGHMICWHSRASPPKC